MGGCIAGLFQTPWSTKACSPAPPLAEVQGSIVLAQKKVKKVKSSVLQYCNTLITSIFSNSCIVCHCTHSNALMVSLYYLSVTTIHCAAFPKANFILNRLVSHWLLNMAQRERDKERMPLEMILGVLLTMSAHLLWLVLRDLYMQAKFNLCKYSSLNHQYNYYIQTNSHHQIHAEGEREF